jgi:AraC family transcriptional regulator
MRAEHCLRMVAPPHSANPTAQVSRLVKRAMSFFEIDPAAAWRCLTDASTLLGRETSSPDVEGQAPRDGGRGGLPRWRSKQVFAYVEANLGSKITIGDLSRLVVLSKSHFSRAFRQSFGFPPMNYVSARRLERAKLMMTSSHVRLSDIAVACGFADQSHLTRSFCRAVGVTPGVWRRGLAALESPALHGGNSGGATASAAHPA